MAAPVLDAFRLSEAWKLKKPFRQRRIAGLLHRELALALNDALRGESGPLVTVTEARPSKDLCYVDVWVSILGEPAERQQHLIQLQREAGRFRYEVAQRVQMRKMPELRFKLDETLDYAERIESLLKASNLSEASTSDEENSEE